MPKEKTLYDFDVFETQGGGVARLVDEKFMFIEKPDDPRYSVGDMVPDDWWLLRIEGANNQPEWLINATLHSFTCSCCGLIAQIPRLTSIEHHAPECRAHLHGMRKVLD